MEYVYVSLPFREQAIPDIAYKDDCSIYPEIIDDSLWFSFFDDNVESLMKKEGNSLRIILRTAYFDFEAGIKKIVVVGVLQPDYATLRKNGRYQFKCKDMHILQVNNFFDITQRITGYGINRKIMKSSSSNHPEYKDLLSDWFRHVLDKKNDYEQFVNSFKGVKP